MKKIDLNLIAFDIIGPAGEARSVIFEAIDKLNRKEITVQQAAKELDKADDLITEAGKNHMNVVTSEAGGEELKFAAIFMHAEDIFLTTQTMSEMFRRLLPLYKK